MNATTITTTVRALYIALELGQDKWLLAFATAAAEKPRLRSMPARDLNRLIEEITKAKTRFGLPADAPATPVTRLGATAFGCTAP